MAFLFDGGAQMVVHNTKLSCNKKSLEFGAYLIPLMLIHPLTITFVLSSVVLGEVPFQRQHQKL